MHSITHIAFVGLQEKWQAVFRSPFSDPIIVNLFSSVMDKISFIVPGQRLASIVIVCWYVKVFIQILDQFYTFLRSDSTMICSIAGFMQIRYLLQSSANQY